MAKDSTTEQPSTPPSAKRKGVRPSRWHRPLWWLKGLAVIALLLSYISIRVDPHTWWPLAFFGIAYPYILLANAAFVCWWLVFRKKRMLPSALAILLGFGHVGEYVQLLGDDDAPADKTKAFRVMSWNVRIFDLYNWNHNERSREEMLDLIRVEDPDILCMQEFLNEDRGPQEPVREQLLSDYRFTHKADEYTAHTKHGHHFGIATFSTKPIVARGVIHFPGDLNNLCLWTDIAVGSDTLRVYNAHLASLRFGDEDYRLMNDLEDATKKQWEEGGKRILRRLKSGFIRRASQMEQIAAHMEKSPHPVIWCGDMNDTPMSYSYHQLEELGLVDAFVESGQGIGHTYIGAFPSFRIDHLMHSQKLRSWGFRTLPDELSDHHPIICSMELR
jgi:endonuclease/exonuclease/phosphatase family metal-dependent hydrolase